MPKTPQLTPQKWAEHAQNDRMLQQMIDMGLPLTRENWIAMNYPFGDKPAKWTSEHEGEVPPPFQDWSKVDRS